MVCTYVLFLCNKVPQTEQFKTISIYYLNSSVGQKSRLSVAEHAPWALTGWNEGVGWSLSKALIIFQAGLMAEFSSLWPSDWGPNFWLAVAQSRYQLLEVPTAPCLMALSTADFSFKVTKRISFSKNPSPQEALSPLLRAWLIRSDKPRLILSFDELRVNWLATRSWQ